VADDPLTNLVADARGTPGPVTLTIEGRPVTIPDVHTWPLPAYDALAADRHAGWARLVLADTDRAHLAGLDLTRREWRQILTAWGQRTGDDVATIVDLLGTVRSFHRPLEADLRRYYSGQDLRDLFRPGGGRSGLTWRGLRSLVEALPAESATKTALRAAVGDTRLADMAAGDSTPHGPWSHEAHRLASVEDVLRQLLWRVVQVTSAAGTKVPFPEPVPRPGVVAKRRRRLDTNGMAYLQYLRSHQGAAPPGTTSLGRVGGR
jgi:hypothetical protein